MAAEPVVAVVKKYLDALAAGGVEPSFAVLFGSQRTGHADVWSDIDLVVVSPRFDRDYGRSLVDVLWRTAARVDSRIEPIPCGAAEWNTDDSKAILEIARREGEFIYSDSTPSS